MEKPTFSSWILTKINDMGISQAEFARRCGFSNATLSRILDGSRKPGLEVCCKLADQMSLPHAHILKRAGLIPGVIEEDEEHLVWEGLYDRLSAQDRDELILLAKYRIELYSKK